MSDLATAAIAALKKKNGKAEKSSADPALKEAIQELWSAVESKDSKAFATAFQSALSIHRDSE